MIREEAILRMANEWADMLANPILDLKKGYFENENDYNKYNKYILKTKILKLMHFATLNEEQLSSFIKNFYSATNYRIKLHKEEQLFVDSNDTYSLLKYSMYRSNISMSLLPPNTRMNLFSYNGRYYVEFSKYGLPFFELKSEDKNIVLKRIKELNKKAY